MHDDRLERIRLTTIRVARRRGIRPSHYPDLVQDVFVHLLEHRPQWLSASPIHDGALWPLLDSFAIQWLGNRFGRWRPSAAARALGKTAIDLERLVVRDGWTRADAVEAVLVSSDGTIRREALQATADTLRLVPRPRDVALDGTSGAGATPCLSNAPDLDAMASAAREALATALEGALRDVGEEDQRILRLKFAREMTMAEIAAALGMPPGGVQKRYERLRRRLRANLESQGISLADVNAALEAPGLNSPLLERLLRDGDEPRKHFRSVRPAERERADPHTISPSPQLARAVCGPPPVQRGVDDAGASG